MNTNRQFAVIGLGRFGTSVALTLAESGYEVLAIDCSEDRAQQLSEMVTHVAIADTTDENALNTLGLRNFDVVIVAIGEDMEANIMTTLLLKDMGVPYIVVKARNRLHGKMLEKIGADRIIYPELDMGKRVAHNLVSSNVLEYIELSPSLSFVEITAPKSLVDKSLAQLNLRIKYEVNVVAIKRGEHLFLPPNPNDKILELDILLIVGTLEGIKRLERID